MKLQQLFTVEIEDDDMLGYINNMQDCDDLENFDTLDEVPDELIYYMLDRYLVFEEIFYEEYTYEPLDITIVK